METRQDVNELVTEILTACGCLAYTNYFEGLDKYTFRSLTLKDLKRRLAPEERRNEIALKINDELLRFSRIVDEVPGNTKNNCKFQEASRNQSVNSLGQSSVPNSINQESNSQPQRNPRIHRMEEEDRKPEIYSDEQLVEQPARDGIKPQSSISSTSNSKPSPEQHDVRESLKRDLSEGSESDSDYEPLLPPEPKVPKTVEEVSLESDSEVYDSSTPNPTFPISTLTEQIPGSSREARSQPQNSAYSFRTRKKAAGYYSNDHSDTGSDSYDTASDSDKSSEQYPRLNSMARRKNNKPAPLSVSNPLTVLGLLSVRNIFRQFSYVKLTPEHTRDSHNCDLDDPLESELQSWEEFFERVGPHIYLLDLEIWSWKAARSKCPFNLLKILRMCSNLKELSLKVQVLPEALQDAMFPRKTLPNLMKISLNHAGEILYKGPLKCILKAASRLQSFECFFHGLNEANDILEMLRDLSCLKTLTFRSYAKDGYMTRDHIVKLAQITAEGLRDLELGNGFWEDVDGESVENLLRRFPNLKRLKLNGNYQGDSLRKPDITISIPPLTSLEYLDIGGNYEFASVDQSPGSDSDFFSRNSNKIITVEDDLKTELFSVTLKFALLPSLKTLILGNLYKIEELHFSSFPVLRVIRVGSPWHLTVKFSENKESRKFSYPLVTDLQLPDCLKDPSFVQNIPARFPNLKKCWIFLPSVKVLRTFFKTMEKSSLEELYLKTQYDFEVTMELCLLGQPSKAPKNYRDYMKYEDLEKYGKFHEFVQFYNIELPPKKIEEMQDLEDKTCAGLKALTKLKILQLEHIPRILRIPRGNLHWTHANAEFTNYCIGFTQYPLSGSCLLQLPIKNLRSCTWPNFIVSNDDAQILYQKGFQNCGDEDMEVVYDGPGTSKTQRRSGVDRRGEKLKVAIQPAMLQASLEFREKKEQN
ncbi:unnamed protein product [Allacma fusca]|uniref:Uncharacterized protein n=1 Tax=Allacma fusca TaxID=39272 RepID=A0A8J2J3X4_9HEXA|nr:unnamed protein product [Allacma fusca]